MIPADHIAFNDDGTAWWVLPDPLIDRTEWQGRDRPCDTCGGRGSVRTDCGPECDNGVHEQGRCQGSWWKPCPADCIDGRHTFTIEVECRCSWSQHGNGHQYRVSIVPGMVLPIASGSQCPDDPHVAINPDGSAWLCQGTPRPGDRSHRITLPPAAAPGMWAVQMRVADRTVNATERNA